MQTDQPLLKETLVRGYRYALALTNDEWVANDLLGEACLAIVKAGARWSEAYLLATVRSKFVDHCRARGRTRGQPVSLNGLEGTVSPIAVANQLRHETRAGHRLDRALSVLRPEEREALYLHAVAGMTAKQIARMTGQPRSTVLSQIQRGRARILEHMAGTAGKVPCNE